MQCLRHVASGGERSAHVLREAPGEAKVENMPKMKTNRSAAKRFKKTSSGKLKHGHAYARHLLSGKTPKRKRHLRKASILAPGDEKKMKRLMPNG